MKDLIKAAVHKEYANNKGGGVQCNVPEPILLEFVRKVFERLKKAEG